jgi:hypothetical protein
VGAKKSDYHESENTASVTALFNRSSEYFGGKKGIIIPLHVDIIPKESAAVLAYKNYE